MTTIAWRPGEIAADSGVSERDARLGDVTKIGRRGTLLFGAAGLASEALRFLQWCKKGYKTEKAPRFTSDNQGFIADGTHLAVYDRNGITQIRAPWFALGSGRDYAIGAMAYGASAGEAVAIARRNDVWTHGPIRVYYA